MIKPHQMKKDQHGFIWDPDAWRENRRLKREAENSKEDDVETEYERAVALWHLRQNMEKRFGTKPWMNNVVDPATLQWNEDGSRVKPRHNRTLNSPQPATKQKRRLW